MRALRLAPIVLLATGCLPARDNPRDSANAPVPVLAIRSGNAPGGGCAVSSSAAEISVASRGSCLLLDASASTDPQGTPAVELSYRYERVDGEDPADAVPIGTPFDGSGPTLVLSSSLVRTFQTLPGSMEVFFRVTVRDGSGANARDTASILLTNAPPVVVTDAPRTIPQGGLPHDVSSTTVTLPFHVTVTDPDGDPPVSVTWHEGATQIATGAIEDVGSIDVDFATDVPTRRAFQVVASDGLEESTAAVASVQIGTPLLWAIEGSQDNGVLATRGYDRSAFDTSIAFARALRVYDHPAGRRIVAVTQRPGFEPEIVLANWPRGDVLDVLAIPWGNAPPSLTFPYDVGGFNVDDTGLITVVTGTPEATGVQDRRIALFELDAAGTSVVALNAGNYPTIPGDLFNFGTVGLDMSLADDGDGHLFLFDVGSSTLRALDASGAALDSYAVDGSAALNGMAHRPFTSEVWIAHGQPLLQSGSAPPEVGFLRVTVGAANEIQATLLPLEGATDAAGLSWIDGERFWTNLGERGYCLVDALAVEAGLPIDVAILKAIAPLSNVGRVVVDDVTGVAWWSDLTAHTAVRTYPNGVAGLAAATGLVETVDPAGQLWWIRGDGLGGSISSAKFPSDDRIATEIVKVTPDVAPDGTGGVWISAFQPRSLRRFAEDGTLADSVNELDVGGNILAMPFALGVAADGEGTVWIQTLSDLYEVIVFEVDTLAPRPADHPGRAPGRVAFTFGFGTNPAGFHAARDHAWFGYTGNDIPAGYYVIPKDGSAPTLAFSTQGEDNFASALLPRSGRLCIVSQAGNVNVRYLTPPSTAVLQTSLDPSFVISGVAASGSGGPAGEEICWAGVQDQNTFEFLLRGYDESGSLVASYQDTNAGSLVFSIAAPSNSEVWLLRTVPGSAGTDLLIPQKITFDAGGTGSSDPGLNLVQIRAQSWLPPY